MDTETLTKKITTLEEQVARLESRINLSCSSLSSITRKVWARSKVTNDFQVKRLNDAISASAGILKNNKRVPKDPVAWQKQIREEWN